MRDHINIRRARNGFIVSFEPDYQLNALSGAGLSHEVICTDTDAVLDALRERFEEMKRQPQETGLPRAQDFAYMRAADTAADARAKLAAQNGSTEPDPADQIHPNNPANRVD